MLTCRSQRSRARPRTQLGPRLLPLDVRAPPRRRSRPPDRRSLNPTIDAILCGTVLLHSHLGFQQVLIDYIPKKRYPGLRKGFWWLLNAATVTVGVGLYEFETNDVGVTEAIRRVWTA